MLVLGPMHVSSCVPSLVKRLEDQGLTDQRTAEECSHPCTVHAASCRLCASLHSGHRGDCTSSLLGEALDVREFDRKLDTGNKFENMVSSIGRGTVKVINLRHEQKITQDHAVSMG